MTRKDLAREIAKKTKLNFRQAENLVIAFGAVVGDVLAKEEKIVYSNFGTFYTVHYPSKIINHPQKGVDKKIVMLPTNAIKWMPSGNIKEMVNNGKIVEAPTTHGRKMMNQMKNKNENATENKKTDIEDSVEIPINKVETNKNEPQKEVSDKQNNQNEHVNIYEELMNDGSKVESTFSDAIRVRKKRAGSFFQNIFKKSPNDNHNDENSDKTPSPSHAGAGIFDVENGAPIPIKKIDIQKHDSSPTQHQKFDRKRAAYEFFGNDKQDDIKDKPKEDVREKEADLSPFPAKTSVSYVDLTKLNIPKPLLQKIPEKLARKYKMVPVKETDKEFQVAMVDPEDIEAKELVKKLTQKTVISNLATEDDINHVLDQYSGLESELEEAIDNADNQENQQKKQANKTVLIESASDNAPAARIVNSLLKRAIREKASDIHIEPAEKELDIRFRIDGILKKKATLPKDIQSAVITRIKVLCNMKIDEQRLPQDGRFSISVDDRKVDFRVSTLPIANGEKVVMRVLDRLSGIMSIDQLGFRKRDLEVLTRGISKSHGMTLATGPTGSGKTTTLYALIQKLFTGEVNIVTLEDPIEYRMPGINQSQVNSAIKYSFASGLRSIVRQDPDIIMIGEIRDGETAEMAVHAALTGHIVLSTLHTNNAAGAAPRLIDMGVEPFLLTSSINCTIGQRLARKICDSCKKECEVSETEMKKVQTEIAKIPESQKHEIDIEKIKFYKGQGCKECDNTGYKGRIGLYEVLEITESIKEMVLKKESSFKIEEKAISEGMTTMLQDGIIKASKGITTLEEVWRTTQE